MSLENSPTWAKLAFAFFGLMGLLSIGGLVAGNLLEALLGVALLCLFFIAAYGVYAQTGWTPALSLLLLAVLAINLAFTLIQPASTKEAIFSALFDEAAKQKNKDAAMQAIFSNETPQYLTRANAGEAQLAEARSKFAPAVEGLFWAIAAFEALSVLATGYFAYRINANRKLFGGGGAHA